MNKPDFPSPPSGAWTKRLRVFKATLLLSLVVALAMLASFFVVLFAKLLGAI